jgi:methylase of polypeptide subunit release factors
MTATCEAEAEELRCEAQRVLDSTIHGTSRNKMGQVATPTDLAIQMAELAKTYFPPNVLIRFLDPALGTGVFFYAAKTIFGNRVATAHGYEIDKSIADVAQQIWGTFGLAVHTADFCATTAPDEDNDKPNLLICNPPYVRHHHLSGERKALLKTQLASGGYCLNGLAGLYCYFLLIADRWLSKKAISIWIVPAEFLDVNYGRWLKQYLTHDVTLLRLHRFEPDDLQFHDALVSSVILSFRTDKPAADHEVVFSGGGTLLKPKFRKSFNINSLVPTEKWGPLFDVGRSQIDSVSAEKPSSHFTVGDLFSVKRGIATGANDFFILPRERAAELRLPSRYLRPILPGPRNVTNSD